MIATDINHFDISEAQNKFFREKYTRQHYASNYATTGSASLHIRKQEPQNRDKKKITNKILTVIELSLFLH